MKTAKKFLGTFNEPGTETTTDAPAPPPAPTITVVNAADLPAVQQAQRDKEAAEAKAAAAEAELKKLKADIKAADAAAAASANRSVEERLAELAASNELLRRQNEETAAQLAQSQLEAYRERLLAGAAAGGVGVIPGLVYGSTTAELDQTYAASVAEYKRIHDEIAAKAPAAPAAVGTPGIPRGVVNAPPAAQAPAAGAAAPGVVNGAAPPAEPDILDPEVLSRMSPEEYAKHRTNILGALVQRGGPGGDWRLDQRTNVAPPVPPAQVPSYAPSASRTMLPGGVSTPRIAPHSGVPFPAGATRPAPAQPAASDPAALAQAAINARRGGAQPQQLVHL